MKIDLAGIDRTQFMVHDHQLFGETVHLIQPQHIGTKWTKVNKHLRSVVVNSNGDLISVGFPKFTNWGENPDNFPTPSTLKGCTVVEKLDGSLLIVSKYKGNYILRTRGTVDATTSSNGYELEEFKSSILSKLQDNNDTWNYSVLFEWYSPKNKIVITYGDVPCWKLIGFVDHSDCSLATQDMLDLMAKKYDLLRPEVFTFDTVSTLLTSIEKWKDKEGVCVYSNKDQTIHKVKSSWYLTLHHMKSELCNVERVIDVWLEQNRPTYIEFYSFILNTFDYELAEYCKPSISTIADASKIVDDIVKGMENFVLSKLKPLKTRKEQAIQIISAYGNTNRAQFVFSILDGKQLDTKDYKKLMFQVLKK